MSSNTARILYWTTERGDDLAETTRILDRLNPDMVVLSELQAGQATEIGAALGMDDHMCVGTKVTPHRNAVLVRHHGPLFIQREHAAEHTRALRIPMVNVELGLRDENGEPVPGTIAVIGHHATFYGPTLRQIEAEWFSRAIQAHGRVLVFGDFNEPPVGEEPALARITDQAHLHDRTHYVHGVGRVPDHRADEALTTAGFIDLARHIAALTGDRRPLAPTAGYGPGTEGQGGELRIDRAYADPVTAEAFTGFEVLDGYEDVSDHRPLLATADLDALRGAAITGAAIRSEARERKAGWRAKARAVRHGAEEAARAAAAPAG
ncbi:endonuclease/exonuclease/phosphatase family protein [Kitasatospora sp. NPDC056783]|uniref:endonuclease/exonuclease/phosphatase family protein n=1 Tax=Kitasatospora sp. NPDC056783 TaxID=3345943 RepID=UPI0036B02FF1